MKFNKLIPELSVSNFDKSLNFYTKVLGFKIKYTRKKFAFLELNKSQIMIQQINNKWKTGKLKYPFGRGINFQIQVKDIKPILTSLKNNKYKLFRKTEQNWYQKENKLLGCEEFLIQDPDGYLLRFSQDIGERKTHSKS
jgi:catechol 2,3-dioxygenase-like lactoylglutathione lyase family enzyme